MSKMNPEPKMFYTPHVFMCQNVRPPEHPRGCCHAKGAPEMLAHMRARVKAAGISPTRINQSGCMERCEMGPTMVIYPEGVWYTYRTKEDIDEIVQSHMIEGKRVERLMLMPTDKFPKDREARLAEQTATKPAAE